MLLRTKGIVFHTIPYSDSRLIAKIYTEKAGLISCIIPVSKSGKGKIKKNLLQPLTQVEVVADRREKNNFHYVREISCSAPYRHLQDDVIKTCIALFLAEVLYKSVREEEANPQLFSFLANSFQILDLQQEGLANFHLCFLVQLSKFLGFFPQQNHSGANAVFDLRDGIFRSHIPNHPLFMDATESRTLEKLMTLTYDTMQALLLTGVMRNMLVKQLLTYYELHLDTIHDIRSHHVLEQVLG